MVKFSIIIPVYNAQSYLLECVESLLNQTFKPYEVILIDDGSIDNSPKLCDELVKNNEGIVKCVHKKNGGPLSARIEGIANSCGDYYYFVDSDDFLEPDTLATLKVVIEEDEPDCIFLGAYKYFDKSNKIELNQNLFSGKKIMTDKCDFYRTIFLSDYFFPMWRRCYKSELFDKIDYSSFYNVKHGEDLLQSLQLLKKCKKAVGIDKCLYNYRENPVSLSHEVGFSRYKESIYVYNLIIKFLKDEDVFTLDDWQKYRIRNAYNFGNIIYDASISKNSTADKMELFNYISNSYYYSEFVSKNELKELSGIKLKKIYKLFSAKKYRTLIAYCNFYSIVKRFKRFLKGIKN